MSAQETAVKQAIDDLEVACETPEEPEPRRWLQWLENASYDVQTHNLHANMGEEFLKAAFGSDLYEGMTQGETTAFHDQKRLGVMSSCSAIVVEALRFARANEDKFAWFVRENRRTYVTSPTCPDVLGDTDVDGTLACYVRCDKCLECHGW